MKNFKRLLGVLLTIAMCLSILPAAYAAENGGAWYDAAVSYVKENGLMDIDEAGIDPSTDADRITVVEALWRAADRPSAAKSSAFTDIDADSANKAAIDWAAETGIISGYSDGSFGGNDPVKREQLVTMLWRYEGSPVQTRATFADTDSISEYAAMAVTWVQNNHIVSGVGENRFAPGNNVKEVELAQILMNYLTREPVQKPTPETLELPAYADGALSIARQGMFSSGGTVTEPVEGEFNASFNWMDASRAGNTAHVDHANVLYQIPENNTGNPIVYLHGYGQSRMGWMTTPDGREGWSNIFLRYGHAAFLVDQPRRGEAGSTVSMTQDGFLDAWAADSKDYKPGDQAWYTHFRIGRVAPELYTGSQFPTGADAQDQFFRQMTPNTGSFDQSVAAAALGEVMADVKEMTGQKSIFVTHSQGGAVGWSVDPENVAAIVAIEPGGTPMVGSEQYNALLKANVPIIIYFGDYMDNGPQDIMSSGFWRGIRDGAIAFAEQYNADGGDATVVNLPDLGIIGNSHFMFQELNNKEIADHIEAWLFAHDLG